ncbi:MAG: cytochrome c biogenesis protein CcdA [Gemmatimonadota bacterium]
MLSTLLQADVSGGLAEALSRTPLLALVTLFGAGVLTSLTPCVYPMIPITASVIAGTAREGQGRGRTVGLTLTYAVGMAMLYAILGAVAGVTGTLFGTVSASPWALLGIGNLLLLFALVMFDVIRVPVPRKLLRWAGSRQGGSYGAVFVMGAASGVVAAPCGAPAFAVVLTWVAATQAGVLGFVYLFVFSLGMTALLVVVGLFSGTLALLPRSGGWMVGAKRVAAILMIAMAQYYFVQAGYNL